MAPKSSSLWVTSGRCRHRAIQIQRRACPVLPLVKGTACGTGVRFVMPCFEYMELEWSSKEYAKRRHMVAQPLPEGRREFTGTRRVGQFWTAYLVQLHRKNCHVCHND